MWTHDRLLKGFFFDIWFHHSAGSQEVLTIG